MNPPKKGTQNPTVARLPIQGFALGQHSRLVTWPVDSGNWQKYSGKQLSCDLVFHKKKQRPPDVLAEGC